MLQLAGKRVVVLGLGASGAAAAHLCLARGASVTGADAKKRSELGAAVAALVERGLHLEAEGHAESALAAADLIVVSPGVPRFSALDDAEKKGVSVIGEVELSVQCLPRKTPIVAIGGTNGKSTTTSLVGALLEAHGRRVFTGGNLGEPLASHVDEAWDVIVLEVSSFQTERLQTFKPRAFVLLNVTDDHLDRYAGFGAYADAKGNAFVRQTSDDAAIVPASDSVCLHQAARGRGRVVTFGPHGDVDVTPDAVVDRLRKESYARDGIALRGGHNALNVAAAIAATREIDLDFATAERVLATFAGLPHRMVLAGEVDGVRFYDDSKGTNVGAAVTALRGIEEARAVLIAGGRDKGGSYAPLVEALRERGRAVVLIGEAAGRIAEAVGAVVPICHAASLEDAVREGHRLAHRGDAVLLSPACSSFDMFQDYKHRGNAFVRAVKSLEVASTTSGDQEKERAS